MNEIKHSKTSQTYKKSRLVIQTYNDQEKTLVLTETLTIQLFFFFDLIIECIQSKDYDTI